MTRCNSLSYVFTTQTEKSLKQLKKLGIIGCELIEEIILSEQVEEGSINRIAFPKIDKLSLERLSNLKRFTGGYPIAFPSLRELNIEHCCAFENFVSENADRSNNAYLFNEMVIFLLSIDSLVFTFFIIKTALVSFYFL